MSAPLDAAGLATQLTARRWIRRIVVHEAVGSTNDEAKALAKDGAPDGTVVIAGRQSAGRGRLGRAWHSAPDLGLYLSVLLRPEEAADRLGRYALSAAVATCRACRAVASPAITIKWPNDVVHAGRKLAGILAELKRGEGGNELVLGIGINVNHRAEDFPEELRGIATSLKLAAGGAGITREAVALVLADALGTEIESVRAGEWERSAETFVGLAPGARGARVCLSSGERGTTDGLDPTGALRVRTDRGIVTVHAGESVAQAED